MSKFQRGNSLVELIFSVAVLVVLLIIGFLWHVGSGYVKCSNYSSLTDRATKFSVISGCFVKTDSGRWVPQAEMTRTTVVDAK